MLIQFWGPEDLINFAFFDDITGDLSIRLVSATSTQIVVSNPSTGAVTTFYGSGFPSAPELENDILYGTLTGWTTTVTKGDETRTIAQVSDFSWGFALLIGALDAMSMDDDTALTTLLNLQPLTFDASEAFGPIYDFNLMGLMQNAQIITSADFGDYIGGGEGDDTINAGGAPINEYDVIFVSNGSDQIILSGTQPASGGTDLVYGFYDEYGSEATSVGAISVTIDGLANTGSVVKATGTDTLVDVQMALDDSTNGLGIFGTTGNDSFTINGGASSWIEISGNQGTDAYDLVLSGGIRLSFHGIWSSYGPSQGVSADLLAGVIYNDGYGNQETISISDEGGRLEIVATDFADNIVGSAANDSFITRTGNDTIDGGAGFDRLRYNLSQITSGIDADLLTGEVTGTWNWAAFTHTVSNIEEIRGTLTGDIMTAQGTTVAVRFRGYFGDDTLSGGGGADTLEGGYGADLLNGNYGNDLIYGEDESDTISGGEGADTVDGGNGADLVYLNQGNDLFLDNGEADSDTVYGGYGNDTIEGGNGDDEFHGEWDNDVINGRLGDDLIYGGDGFDTIYGGDGNDAVTGGNGRDVVYLGRGHDVFNDNGQGGDLGRDLVYGGDGDDTIEGGNGNDTFYGDVGNDVIQGRLGDDVIYGGDGFDTVYAGDGNDTVTGGNGRDLTHLGNGNDVFNDNGQGGDLGRDTVYGGNGNDTIEGGNGDDSFFGDVGNDVIRARLGNDAVFGGDGFDFIDAGDGNDTVYGGNGRDTVLLGAGDDRFVDTAQAGELGQDTITGGAGADTFVFAATSSADVITDFEIGTDQLHLASALVGGRSAAAVVSTYAEVVAEGVMLDFGAGNSILLEGITSTAGLENDIFVY